MLLTSSIDQANIFVHFIPVDHDDENEKDAALAKLRSPSIRDRVKSVFSGLTAKKKNIGGHEQDNHDEVTSSSL